MVNVLHWSERVKNYVEILAILVGGSWALFTFVIKEEPGLALRRKGTSTIEWSSAHTKGYSKANFGATLENTGTSIFHIQKVHFQAWLCDDPSPARGENAKYLDAKQFQAQGKIFFDTIYEYKGDADLANPGKPFIGRYNEGAVWNEHFEFLVKNDSNKVVLFYVTFYESGHPAEPFEWTNQWDYVGGTDSGAHPAESAKRRVDEKY